MAALIPTAETAEMPSSAPTINSSTTWSKVDSIRSTVTRRTICSRTCTNPTTTNPPLPAAPGSRCADCREGVSAVQPIRPRGAQRGQRRHLHLRRHGGHLLAHLGTHSDGYHFVGRSSGIIDPRTLGVVRASTHSFATICNQFVGGTPEDLPVPHLIVELDSSGTSVVVTLDTGADSLDGAGVGQRRGRGGRAGGPGRDGQHPQFRETRETPINGTRRCSSY